MDPRELTLAVTAAANALYESLSPEELAVLAAVFSQLGDTLITLAAQKALRPPGPPPGGLRGLRGLVYILFFSKEKYQYPQGTCCRFAYG